MANNNGKWRFFMMVLTLVMTCVQATSFKSYAVINSSMHMQQETTDTGCHPLQMNNSHNVTTTNTNDGCHHSVKCDIDCNHCLSVFFVATIFKDNYWQSTPLENHKIISSIPHFYSIRLPQAFKPPIS